MKEVEQQVISNIIRILDEAVIAIKKDDIKALKDLSNQTVHDATVYQEEHTISIAVLIYTLSKIFEREFHYAQFKGWKNFLFDCMKSLETARDKLKEGKHQDFDAIIRSFIINIKKVDPKLRNYIQDVFQRAKINKASRLYEHGLSVGRTAELLGVTRFELMDYIGKTYIADVRENITVNAKKRLDFARELFS